MPDIDWKVIDTVSGDLQAEILRGLFEAQEIPVVLSQEGIGRSVYHVTVGPMSQVDILVPASHFEQAKEILEQYHSGMLEQQSEEESEEIQGSNQEDI